MDPGVWIVLIHLEQSGNNLLPYGISERIGRKLTQSKQYRTLRRHFAFFIQWDWEEEFFRVCSECNHAFPMSLKEIRRVIPTYRPLASKGRRRLVQLVFGIPVLVIGIGWNIAQLLKP